MEFFKKERNWDHLHIKNYGTKHAAYIIENITGIFLMIKFWFLLCPTKENSLFLKVVLLKKAIKWISQNIKRKEKKVRVKFSENNKQCWFFFFFLLLFY